MSALALIAKVERLRRLRAAMGRPANASPTDQLGLLDWIPKVSPNLDAPDHLAPLVEALEATLESEQRIIVSTPPQHGKTFTVTHGLVWLLRRRPWLRNTYVTYEQTRADDVSLAMQRIAADAGIAVEGSRRNWKTRDGGGLKATGIGGPLTGFPTDGLMLIDDPIKNRADAESATYRRRTLDWFRDVAMTRVHPGASVLVVQTRWHPDDLAGQLEKEGGWRVINLPAIDDDGRALWEKRRPLKWLLEQRRIIGEYGWSSLYMGRPRPRGGALFGDAHFYAALPTSDVRYSIGLDFAYSTRTHSDWSVAVVLLERLGKFHVLEVVRRQVPPPQFAAELSRLRSKYPGAPMRAFVGGTELGVVSMLQAAPYNLPIHAITTREDKFSRAQPASAAWNEGRILLPVSAPWIEPFLSEVQSFTGVKDANDDQVDALVSAFHPFSPVNAPASVTDFQRFMKNAPRTRF